MRTYNDTQIFKEGGIPTEKEKRIIEWFCFSKVNWKSYDDKANNLYAISFTIPQDMQPKFGEDLVDMLNNNGEGDWFVGDIDEEYVFVN